MNTKNRPFLMVHFGLVLVLAFAQVPLVELTAHAQGLKLSTEEPSERTIEEVGEVVIPKELLEGIPDPSTQNRLRVDSRSFEKFQKLLLPELRTLIANGTLQFDAVSKLNYAWRLHDDWYESVNKKSMYSLSAGELQFPDKPQSGIAFKVSQIDLQEKSSAVKLLWNIWSNHWSLGSVASEFELLELKEGKLSHHFEGKIERVYPGWLGKPLGLGQLFREKLTWTTPKVLSDMEWLTFRFIGEREDMVWLYSPAVGAKRMLTGSNRSDPLYKFSFTLDDFFTWSGKTENVVPRILEKTYGFVPFLSTGLSEVKRVGDRCRRVLQSGQVRSSMPGLRWNFESRRYPGGGGWLPSSGIYVPRELWKVELSQKDSHSSYGRQILYVDSQIMLPFYKFVYSKSGRLSKFVFSSFGLSHDVQSKEKFPFAEYTVAVDLLRGEQAIADFRNFTYCTQESEALPVAAFDPSKLGPQVVKAADGNEKDDAPTKS